MSLSAAMTRMVASTVAPAPWRAPVELDEAAEELEVPESEDEALVELPEPVSEEEAVFELEPEPEEVAVFELEPELEDVEPAELDDPAAEDAVEDAVEDAAAEDEVLAWLDNVVAAVAEVVVALADVVRDGAVLELDEPPRALALAPAPAAPGKVTELVSVLVTVDVAFVEVEDVGMTAAVALVTEMLSMYTWAVPAVQATTTLRTPEALEAVAVPLNFFQSPPMIKTTGK